MATYMKNLKLLSIVFLLVVSFSAKANKAPIDYLHPPIYYIPYMRQLIHLAHDNPQTAPFTALIIDRETGKVLCTGVNNSKANPTWHGEIRAIDNCAEKYPHLDWTKTALITTGEPCPMCSAGIIWSQIPLVVYGTSIQFLTEHHWNQIQIHSNEVIKRSPFYQGTIYGGVDHEETDKLFEKIPQPAQKPSSFIKS